VAAFELLSFLGVELEVPGILRRCRRSHHKIVEAGISKRMRLVVIAAAATRAGVRDLHCGALDRPAATRCPHGSRAPHRQTVDRGLRGLRRSTLQRVKAYSQ
jgi:hypothetical protein